MKRFLRVLSAIFLSVTVSSVFAQTRLSFSESERQYLDSLHSLRVGVNAVSSPPYWGGNAKLPTGLTHDFTMLLSKQLDIPVEYVQYDSVQDVFDAIEQDSLDFAVGYVSTPERAKKFLFSDPLLNIKRVALIINEKIDEELSRLNWACVKGTVNCQFLDGLGYKKVTEIPSDLLFSEAIYEPGIDAILDVYDSVRAFLSNAEGSNLDFTINYSFGSQEASFILGLDNKALQGVLNKVIAHWRNNGDLERIHNKFGVNFDLYRRFLKGDAARAKLRYSINDNLFPYFYYDEENGEYGGYIYELFSRISARAPIDFEFIPSQGMDVYSMLLSGAIDIYPLYNHDNIADSKFLSTKVYTNAEYALLKSEASSGKAVGILDKAKLLRELENVDNFVVYDDLDEMVSDLKSGNISSGYMNSFLSENLIAKNVLSGIEILPTSIDTAFSVPLSLIVNSNDDETLALLEGALNTVSKRELASIWNNYNRVNYNLGYDRELVTNYVLIALIATILVSLIVYRYYQAMKKKVERYYTHLAISQGQVEWLSSIIDSIPFKVCIRDHLGKVLLTNEKYKKATLEVGYADENALAMYLLSETRDEVHGDFWEVVEIKNQESVFYGQHFEVINKTISSGDSSAFTLTFFINVTAAKEREAGLIASQRMATELAEQKSQFVAVVSHELRTPISAMLGFMEILNHDYNRPDREVILNNAVYSANRLKFLVDDILDFSKLEANQLSINATQGNLVSELCPVIRSFELLAKNKSLKFHFHWTPTKYLNGEVDFIRLNQIINNVLSNAVKFTENGLVSVEVSNTHDRLILCFRDTGIGMNEAQLSTLFEPFVQAEDDISRTYGGTGLGMSIVRSLIKLMGGSVDVQSALGLGTRITINVPVKASPMVLSKFNLNGIHTVSSKDMAAWYEALAVTFKLDGSAGQEGKRNLYPDMLDIFQRNERLSVSDAVRQELKGHVLVVDDDMVNRVLLTKQLEELGVSSTLAGTGLEAYEILCNAVDNNFDVIITDCHMPVMNGFAFSKKVRNSNGTFNVSPIIGCTADNSVTTETTMMEVGMNAILYKPYTLDELYNALRPFLSATQTEKDTPVHREWRLEMDDKHSLEMSQAIIDSFSATLEHIQTGSVDMKHIVHRVKGSASILKHDDLLALCYELEEHPSNNALVTELCTVLGDVIEQAKKRLSNA
ncbi:transporter substrate-binding domain-containing protein [Vibrio cholerae]|nr:transporter substrate-binding domain-containing protein [Vibrio cholerae]